MTDNVLLVHWHDLGRYLGAYGHADVSQPSARPARQRRHPLHQSPCDRPAVLAVARFDSSPGRYPQSNGLIGLAHHGWEYRAGVQTLPALLSESGWHTALFGMQHETSFPSRLGFDEYDVSNSYCEYVVERATDWLEAAPSQPFLLTAGFFETHRPYPHDRYEPAQAGSVARARLPARHRRRPAGPRRLLRVHRSGRRGRWPTARHPGVDRPRPHHLGGVPDRPRARPAQSQVDAVRGGHRHRADRAPAHRERRRPTGVRRPLQRRRSVADLARTARRAPFPKRCRAFRTHPTCVRRRGANGPRVPRSTPRRPITIPSIRYVPFAQRITATSRTTRHDRCWTCRGTSRTALPARRSSR